MPRRVLFLCTGNYYRSRFAESLFNARARERGLDWHADSAGLAPRCWTRNPGAISPHTVEALATRGIQLPPQVSAPRDVTRADFERADRVIALCEREHRPLVEAHGPPPRPVGYWHVEDVQRTLPATALAHVEREVEALVDELATQPASSSSTSAWARSRSSVE